MTTRALFPILACVALLGSACGPSGQTPTGTSSSGGNNVIVSTPPPQTGSTPAPGAQPTSAAAAPTAAAPQPTAQASGTQEITVNALQGEPDNLDPNRSNFATEAAVIRQVFEPLLTFDKDLKPVPAAASSYDVSQDGKTYSFHLRDGAKRSAGQPVTAKNFVYSFKRILDPATAADYVTYYTNDDSDGAADFNSQTSHD